MKLEPNALLVDVVLCTGCRDCMQACMQRHGESGDAAEMERLSAHNYTQVEQVGDHFVRRMCMHCVTPSCTSACPVAALQKTELGLVVYNSQRCIGCRYCMLACPFDVPRYEWDKAIPAVAKCDGCYDRLERGENNACAAACRYGATVSGPRSEMIAEAHKRIREYPEDYYPRVYGEHEIGGTSVLVLSPVAFEELGFAVTLGDTPLPDLTRAALERIPGLISVGGAALLAIWWITRRRDDVARYEAARRAGEVSDEAEAAAV